MPKIPLKFIKAHGRYNKGDVAAFDGEAARKLVEVDKVAEVEKGALEKKLPELEGDDLSGEVSAAVDAVKDKVSGGDAKGKLAKDDDQSKA